MQIEQQHNDAVSPGPVTSGEVSKERTKGAEQQQLGESSNGSSSGSYFKGYQPPPRNTMPVKVDIVPPPPNNSKQLGVTKSLLYNGSKFRGFQKSKGNSYEVEVVLQVGYYSIHANN